MWRTRHLQCGVLFFFQAEDGIRDFHVTGVQTCALPISPPARSPPPSPARRASTAGTATPATATPPTTSAACPRWRTPTTKIGRASCREGVEISLVAATHKQERHGCPRERLARRADAQIR